MSMGMDRDLEQLMREIIQEYGSISVLVANYGDVVVVHRWGNKKMIDAVHKEWRDKYNAAGYKGEADALMILEGLTDIEYIKKLVFNAGYLNGKLNALIK